MVVDAPVVAADDPDVDEIVSRHGTRMGATRREMIRDQVRDAVEGTETTGAATADGAHCSRADRYWATLAVDRLSLRKYVCNEKAASGHGGTRCRAGPVTGTRSR